MAKKDKVVTKKAAAEIIEELGLVLDSTSKKIIDMLEKSKVLSEDTIAKRLAMKINDVRKLLYAISVRGVITYNKKRDPKKKWWYLYYWSLDIDRIIDLLADKKDKDLRSLNSLLAAEKEFMFKCEKCKTKCTYESALDRDFTCEDCGDILEEIKSSKELHRLEDEIIRLETEMVHLRTKPKEKNIPIADKTKGEQASKLKKKTKLPAKKATKLKK